MVKMKISVLIIVAIIASIVAYGIGNAIKVTNDISLEEVKDCRTVYWNETHDIMGNCTYTYEIKTCSDEPLNKSCETREVSNVYECAKDKTAIEKSREECADRKFNLEIDKTIGISKYSLDYGDWGKCSYNPVDDSLVVICDSNLDGNADGICQSGESCVAFIVTKDRVERMFRNSRNDFVPYDPTFYQEEIDLEVEG